MNIVLGITGSIAAYKAADIASQLVKAGHEVHAVMTRAATEFITPLTLQVLTRQPVLVTLEDEKQSWKPGHIELADRADLFLVAPASADAPRAVAMTFEWLDSHGYFDLRQRAVTVINGVSRRSQSDVEQAEQVARGQCRALVRIPWDDHLSLDRSPRNELKSLRPPTRRAYLALSAVVAGVVQTLEESPSSTG